MNGLMLYSSNLLLLLNLVKRWIWLGLGHRGIYKSGCVLQISHSKRNLTNPVYKSGAVSHNNQSDSSTHFSEARLSEAAAKLVIQK